MLNYNTQLQSNNTYLQELLQVLLNKAANNGVQLPELSNPANASELLNGKELINGEGNVITGSMANNGTITATMDGIDVKSISIPEGYTSGGTIILDGTIDEEVDEQTGLIAQIKTVANSLPEAGSSENPSNTETITLVNNTGNSFLCGASYVGAGSSVQLPLIKSGTATQIPIMSTNNFGSMTATTTSGSVGAVFYDYVKLFMNGTTTGSNVFCAMVYCTNVEPGSTITVSL